MKNQIRKLIDELRLNKCSIKLNATGNINLILEDNAELSEELIAKVKKNKPGLVDYLKSSLQAVDLRIEKVATQPSYPISNAQRRLWVLSQFEGGSATYNMPNNIYLNQDIHIEFFKRAIDSTIERHEILRTVFKEDKIGEIRQWILNRDDLKFKIDYKDFRETENKQEKAENYITEDSYKAFDLVNGPLLRAALLQLEDQEYVFYYNMHHIISDGWSMDVLSKDVLSYYEAYKENKQPELKPLAIQYKDYSTWQLSQLEEESFKAHKNYWLESLKGELPLLDLPVTKQRPRIRTGNGYGISTYIDSTTTHKLNNYSQENGGGLFMSLLAVWNVLMYRYTSQKDLIIGTPVAGREHADLENQIGFYVNTLALRNEINPEESFNDFYRRLKNTTLNAYSHQAYPFDRLVDELGLARDTSRSAVFDVMLTLQNVGEKMAHAELSKEELNQVADQGFSASKFDINITFQEEGNYLSLHIVYNTDVYEREMVEGLIKHYKQLLNVVLANPGEKLSLIDYLSEQEKQELLYTFNDTEVEYPKNKTLIDLFEEQVAKTPGAIAIAVEEKEISYRELNELSNQLANYLQKNYKIKPDDLVGILQERSEWTIISILGVLKSGGAYVPIDPEYPQERKEYIVKDTKCKVCIDENELAKFRKSQKKYSHEKVISLAKPAHLAYMIYTSGSTGQPKGVMIEHGNLSQFLNNALVNYSSDGQIIKPFLASPAFDISVFQMFVPLLTGGRSLIVSKKDFQDMAKFTEILSVSTVIDTVPAMYEPIVSYIKSQGKSGAFKSIKRVFVGGDKVPDQLLKKLTEVFSSAYVTVLYGPTEGTIFCTDRVYNGVKTNQHFNGSIIGTPNDNVAIYILNEKEQLQPVGVTGEICIGGAGVARGYLNKEALTKEKFIANPFKAGERLYKTGDSGRWLPDGTIEFVGRRDDQVKIRGYRIELGEIEHALQNHAEIEEAVVLAKENQNNEKELVAYIISKKEQNTSALRSYLKEILPEYMLPAYYVQLEALPLNANGKVNKKFLPDPQGLGLKSGVEYVAPGNEIEEKLLKIWKEILRKEKEDIGIDEGFFATGGNSIKLIALKSKIEGTFKIDCSVTALFKYTTIRQQAEMLLKESSFENESDMKTNDLTSVFAGENNVESNNDIAVIGMSIKAPGSKNIHEFWKNLRNGTESITHFSREELLSFGISEDLLNNEHYVLSNSYLEDKEYFDANFFGYLPDEAKLMDPQTRIFHEVIWSALEDSGYDPLSYKGLIGLYAGAASNLEWEAYSRISNEGKIDEFTAKQLSDKDFLNTLIAHKLNLNGPVNSINTACSTSLVAIHHAVKSILMGECHIAIAGGISITNKRKEVGYLHQEGMILSKDGHNRTFDSDSSGTVGGEGAGAVVLKKLSEAIKDGDQIYAIIKGSAINNDGNRKVGFTAPSVDGQSDVIRRAHKVARVKPESISYVEAHGTATKLGDPIEVLALTTAFGKGIAKYCALGSVKTNLGHLDTAAGVVGFIKTALCLKHTELVPSLHFKSPNSEINFEESPFYINTELKEWPVGNFPRRAGISSFGIGGTNAHVVLEEPPIMPANLEEPSRQIITLSAKTSEALERQKENLQLFLKQYQDTTLPDLAWTLQNKRSFLYRASFVAQTREEVIEGLQKTEDVKFRNKKANDRNKKIAFLFPGGGSQYQNMGLGLYEIKNSVFRKTMDDCFEISEKLSDINFKSILYPDKPNKKNQVDEIINALPLLFMFEYSLAKQMEYYGIRPDIMIGHSMGEYVAACFGGSLTLEGALKMSIKRGELMQELPKGSMMAVEMPGDKIGAYLSDRVDLAAVNSPTSSVISGETDSIMELSKKFEQEGISAKLLHISHASHSVMMEPMLDKFTKAIENIEVRTSKIPYISNLTGLQITSEELNDKKYWSSHIRSTVRFSSGINEVLSHDNIVLIEVGPGNSLSNFARQHFKKNTSAQVHQLIRHSKIEEDDTEFLLNKIADLWQSGLEINWSRLNNEQIKSKLSLPTYAFERTKYPMGRDVMKKMTEQIVQFNEEKRLEESEWYYEPSWKKLKLPQQQDAMQETDWCLIFSDEGTIGQNIAYSPGMSTDKTILVKGGSHYKKINECEFELNPYDYEGYEKLFNELSIREIHPAHIVHLLTLDQNLPGETKQENIEKNKVFGFYSLLHIAKELNKIDNQLLINLSVITNNLESIFDQEVVHPSKALISGLLIVISQENPMILGRLIDMPLENNKENGLTDLIKEINSNVREKFIAYRNNTRWVKNFNNLILPSLDKNQSKIKNGGTYLITGGLGGLGFTYAKYLQKKYNANLILIGRSDLSNPEDENTLLTPQDDGNKDLERKNRFGLLQKNGNVLYYNVNISDLSAMKKVIEKSEKKFGEINGVIHTAAVTRQGAFVGINFLSVAECERQFDPKVNGIHVIDELFRNRELDFCVFTSSLASIIGGKEFGAYAPASAYLDYFSRAGKIKNCVSVNFGALNFNEGLKSDSVFNQQDDLNQQEIVKVLETLLLAEHDPQILVSTTKLDHRIKKWVYPKTDSDIHVAGNDTVSVNVERSNLSTPYSSPNSKTEVELCQMFEEFFGTNEIGIDDDFFELGGDSLKAMTLIYRIHKKSNVQLKIKDIFENSNIRNLGRQIDLLTGISQMQQKRSTMKFENKIEL